MQQKLRLIGEFDLFFLDELSNDLLWKVEYLYDYIDTTDIVRLTVVSDISSTVDEPHVLWILLFVFFILVNRSRVSI